MAGKRGCNGCFFGDSCEHKRRCIDYYDVYDYDYDESEEDRNEYFEAYMLYIHPFSDGRFD